MHTFLFADIRGYTKFTQRRGDEAAAKLTAKFAMIVRALVADFNGTVFEQRGDEVLCVFSSPRRCLRLAVALQQRFVEETAADANLPLAVGIGIDAGEAILGPDGFRGGALNLAARLCDYAKAGEVLASPEVTHLARNTDGIRYVVLDDVVLKGLIEPVRPIHVMPEGEDPAQQIAALLAAATPVPPTAHRARWLPGPFARRPKRTLAGVAVLAVVVAGSVVAAVHGSGTPGKLRENSVGLFDPRTGSLTRQVRVDDGPIAIAAGYGSVWTVNADANTVSRVDRSSLQVRTIGVGVSPSAIAIGLNAVWIANSGGTVSRIDPANNQVQTIPVGADPGGLAIAGSSVWVTNTGAGTVSRIDPATNKVVEQIPVGASPTGIGAGRDVWVANSADGTVSKINGQGRTHTATSIPVGHNPKGVAVVGDTVWVSNNLDDTVDRIATSGTSVAATVPVGSQPTQLAAVGGHVWVATQANESLTEVDPGSDRPIGAVHLGAIPGGVAAAGGKLWVTTLIDPARHRGGTIHLVGQDLGSIDPNYVGFPSQIWLLNSTYDGLVGFRHATGADGTAIVPNLATTIPSPTNNGRTYTFQLRAGIRWSTGGPVTVSDVRRGLQRAIAAGMNPLQQQIAGAARCGLKRCRLSGVVVDPVARTVTITLVRPDGTFINNLAGDAFAAPAVTPLAQQKTRPIPATGPYQIAQYKPGKLIMLTRNRFFRQWSAAAEPAGFPDAIQFRSAPPDFVSKPGHPQDRYSRNQMQSVSTVETGQADWAEARVAAPVSTLEARFGSRLRVTSTETMHGVFLNTRMPPFNDERVRRALSFAVDRTAVKDNWFTPADITCQMVPPNYPGYRPYCPYTLRPGAAGTWQAPDLATALRLVKESPTRGMAVTVYSEPAFAPGLRPVIAALRTLGYRAKLVVYDRPDYFGHVGNSRYKIQAASYGWVATDANAASFLTVYKCQAFTPSSENNLNPAHFCDPSIDRLMTRAQRLQTSSPAAANDLWAQVDHRIVDAAPWIPLVTPSWVDVLSTRIHNYQRNPLIGVFFDQMWVR